MSRPPFIGHDARVSAHAGVIGIFAGLSWILFVALELIPWFGLLCALVVLVPLVMLGLKYTAHDLLIGGMCGSLLTLVLFGVPATLIYAAAVWLPAALMAAMIERGRSLDATVLSAAVGPLVAGFLAPFMLVVSGDGSIEPIRQSIRLRTEETLELYRAMGVTEEDLASLGNHLEEAVTLFLSFFPSLFVCGVITVTLINYHLVVRFMTGRVGTALRVPLTDGGSGESPVRQDADDGAAARTEPTHTLRDAPTLSGWQLHDGWVWVLIGILLFVLLPLMPYRIVWLNLFGLIFFSYVLQGLAVMSHWATTHEVARWLRYGTIAALLVQPLLLIPVGLVGLADIWIDSRKLRVVGLHPS